MSIAGNNVITRLNYIQKEVGRKVKSSKKYHQWEFSLNGNYHKIELFHSLVSGRKKLVVDGDYILKDDSYFNDFRYEFELDGKILELKQKKMNEYELFICDKSFNEMKKEEQEGKYIDLVKKQIEKLKLNNEYNKIYKNNRNKIYEEHDFEQEEEEDEEYENNNYGFQNNYNYKKNIQYSNNNFSNNFRNDDDFYKSNGDDFDFSQTAFEVLLYPGHCAGKAVLIYFQSLRLRVVILILQLNCDIIIISNKVIREDRYVTGTRLAI